MAEEQEDYAVAAAREWFADDRAKHVDGGNSAELYALDGAEIQLAAIIRKHVPDNIDDINKSLMQ